MGNDKTQAAIMQSELIDQAVKKYSREFDIDEKFLSALIETESNFNAFAFRYEPNYRWTYSPKEMAAILNITKDSVINMQKCSYGLCQIMGAVFHELSFNIPQALMYDVSTNIECASKYLSILARKYNLNPAKDYDKLYDCFNSGRVDNTDGNQKNVDRFNKNYFKFV